MTALKMSLPSNGSTDRAFLDVERSVRGLRWAQRLLPEKEPIAIAISQNHDLPMILGRILAARDITPEHVDEYLNPTIRHLMPDPSRLRDMDKAAERFARAIKSEERIAVFGDYDVDGAASSALISRFLATHGKTAEIYIPDRMLEGYGPSITAFEQLISDGAQLIVTVDCGTSAQEPIARARELGVDVIVIDHHQASERLPEATAIVNPNRLDDISGEGHLAAAGVVYLFLVAVMRYLRQGGWYDENYSAPDLLEWLELVALATVCDVVPLTGLNRAFVRKGLDVMRLRCNPGVRALCDAANLNAAPNTYHLGFVLGPRLNAGGRIGNSGMAARLLGSDDEVEVAEIAATLQLLNSDRQAMQAALQEEALAQAEAACEANPNSAIVTAHGDQWHKGLIGLAAARLCERFSRPALAVTWDSDGTGSGSARSIPGVDLGAAVRDALSAGLLLKGGGHAMAAGFTLTRDKYDSFVAYMEEKLRSHVEAAGREPVLNIDGALLASGATPDLMNLLDQAGPYGVGNPQPRFAFPAHHCKFVKTVGENHVRCSFYASDGARLDAIAFNSADTELGELLLSSNGMPLHVAGHLRRSDWGGREKVELHIEDAAKSAQSN